MVELVVSHNGKNWVAKNESLTAEAPTLDELDIEVRQHFKNSNEARVLMAFDNSTIPQWMRQYAQHYFNRVIEV
jgi:hypothetical protein